MRAVLDPGVLIAALLNSGGESARLLRGWLTGEFELVCSPGLLRELRRAAQFPRLLSRLSAERVDELIALINGAGCVCADPLRGPLPARSVDGADDYLIGLALTQGAGLITADADLLALGGGLPIQTPGDFALRLGL